MNEIKVEVCNQIKKLSNLMTRYITHNKFDLKDFRLSRSQSLVLSYIDSQTEENKPVYQKDIEKYFLIRRSTATECLKKLESLGLIKRTQEKTDARLKRISLTTKAKKRIEILKGYIGGIESEISKGITNQELLTLLSIITKMQNNLSKKETNNV